MESPKKFSHRDGEQDSDELPDLLPTGEERDGCWLPELGSLQRVRSLLGLPRSSEEAERLRQAFYTNSPRSSSHFHEGVKKFVTYSGVEVSSDKPVEFLVFCFGFE